MQVDVGDPALTYEHMIDPAAPRMCMPRKEPYNKQMYKHTSQSGDSQTSTQEFPNRHSEKVPGPDTG